ncbi:hypothetical protein [Leptothoe sp. PORK10 BA2]|uniref:hypothetical protein n=1 Tax=Leptothoe sp. PORK10 BA2 TaxID=3110254 RepID=UPI002B1FC1AF|nr:hypothetical protein [Leptothoe sp. PORK10 BA2]MEA5465701.1 hypothetical protein [Leptothoe sp. PORK10 BA2]
MTYLKRLWQIAPRILRSLLTVVLLVTVAGFSTAAMGAQTQPSPAIPAAASPHPSDTRLATRTIPTVYSVPSTCSVPIIPAIVTAEEIELRQYQLDFAKFIEQEAELDHKVNLTSQRDLLSIERFRLDCEIMLRRAQQILAKQNAEGAENRVDPPFDITITAEEVELRKRQFELAKQIDNDEIIAQEAGVASLNQLWSARRNRIDADILLTQAAVQRSMQNGIRR